MECKNFRLNKGSITVFAPDYTYPEGSALLNYNYLAVAFKERTGFFQLQSCSDGILTLVGMPDYIDQSLEAILTERVSRLQHLAGRNARKALA